MKVLFSTIGSRGDVQPLLALALELQALGHEAAFCVPPNFKEWVESFGMRCTPIGPDLKNLPSPPPGVKLPKPSPEQLRQFAAFTLLGQFKVLPEAAKGCDLIVAASAIQVAARSVAEMLMIPYVFVAYSPAVLPSPEYPPAKMLTHYPQGLPAAVNHNLWRKDAQEMDGPFGPALNEERAKLGLSAVDSVQRHVFTDRPWLAADPALAPAPKKSPMQIVQTGAWLLPDQSPLPEELDRFLANGKPPVYFGLGSMRGSEPMSRIVIEAARTAGLRAIVSQGWGNLGLIDSGDDCISIGDVSHEMLFSRVAAVVHHGGAGTTTAAAKAGKPQVIIPHVYDQFWHAARLEKLGVGVECPPRDQLTVRALTAALREVSRRETKSRAESLAKSITLDGAKRAAQRLVSEFGKPAASGQKAKERELAQAL
ncbi:glycosyltransferase [Sorangium sp. So ce1151]|uniref:glycosyltransferase n=1 Tax=Sorangium sp. So ce1151 TaxID=3133332 RepID=UPI003F5F4430